MSSLIAGRVSSYESHKHSYTCTRTQSDEHSRRCGELQSFQSKTLAPYLISHNTHIHHFTQGIDRFAAI